MSRSPIWKRAKEIARLYEQEGRTLQDIGDLLGASRETIRSIICESGVATVTREDRRLMRLGPEVRRLYVDEDKTVRQTAEALYISLGTVSKVLRSLDIPIKVGGKNYHRSGCPEIRKLKIGESLDLPRMNTPTKYTYVRYYGMAKSAGIKVSVRVISDDKVRVTRRS